MNQESNVSVPTEEELNNNKEEYEKNTKEFVTGNDYYIKDRTKGGIIKAKCIQNSETSDACAFKNVVKTDRRIITYPHTNPSWVDKHSRWFSGGKKKSRTKKRRTRTQKRRRTKTRNQKRR
jgi:hypothetical protein